MKKTTEELGVESGVITPTGMENLTIEGLETFRTLVIENERECAEPFGYWFKRERRFADLEEAERYFDADERRELLKPLFTFPPAPQLCPECEKPPDIYLELFKQQCAELAWVQDTGEGLPGESYAVVAEQIYKKQAAEITYLKQVLKIKDELIPKLDFRVACRLQEIAKLKEELNRMHDIANGYCAHITKLKEVIAKCEDSFSKLQKEPHFYSGYYYVIGEALSAIKEIEK